jgi:hypothetical protein
MKNPTRALCSTVMLVATVSIVAQAQKIDFEADVVGSSPKGFSFALTGQGEPGVWLVRKDDSARGNVLVQSDADRTDYRFPVAIFKDFSGADVALSVAFKAIAGKGDQGAGLVWRYRDANNYYITRCNALEDNCTIYRVVNGKRQAFSNKSVKVPSNTWHTLSVDARGDHFVVTFNGQSVLDARDGTFKEPGKVGLWTKADSVIAFDAFAISGK